jgi:hypothetical protein
MRIASLFILASMTTLFACGGDDSDDTAGETGTATDTATATATATDSATATATETDTATATATATDTDTATATATDTDPSTSTDPTDASSSGDPTTGVDSTGTDTGGADVCAQYCATYIANCTDPKVSDLYADEQACLDACAGWDVGEMGAMDGDSAECRLYHATAAADAPGVHCVHAQEVPEAACV